MRIDKKSAVVLFVFVMGLMTACSVGDTSPATTTAPAASTPAPAADAGPDQSVFVGAIVKLNGSNSSSAQGNALTYSWSLRIPPGSTALLSDRTTVNPTLTVDIGGTYEAILIVKDGNLTSAPDTVLIVVGATNVAPAAAIAPYPHALFKSNVTLDGSMSNDANFDLLKFKWKLTGRPNGSVLTDSSFSLGDTAAPLFTPDVLGNYRVQLVVNDGALDSAPAEITISAENKPGPTANAGPDQTVPPTPNTPTAVQLQGNGNAFVLNSDGTTATTVTGLQYSWAITPQGNSPVPAATAGLDTTTPTFTVGANRSGTYIATLSVTEPDHPDPTRKTTTDSVLIRVAPKAIALPDAGRAQPGANISFTGDTSIGPGGTGLTSGLTYRWSMVQTPASGGTQLLFLFPFSTNATATVLSAPSGTYTGILTVRDSLGNADSDSATYQVTSGPIINSVTLLAFRSPFVVGQGATGLTLSGSNSWTFPADRFITPSPDPTTATASLSGIIGTPSCQWTSTSSAVRFTSQPPCTASSATATFVASPAGTYPITLNVSDTASGITLSSQANFSVRVNAPPNVTLSASNNSPGVCTLATVNATVSDGDGTGTPLLPYTWTITIPPEHSRGGKSYTSKVTTPTIFVDIPGSAASILANPAFFSGTTSGSNPSATFRPDLPATFTVTLEVQDNLGVSGQASIPLTSPALDPPTNTTASDALRALRGTSSTNLGSCAVCHKLDMWGDGVGTAGPDHSGKGLQLFGKYNSAGIELVTHGGPSSLPIGATRESFCALFQDFTQ